MIMLSTEANVSRGSPGAGEPPAGPPASRPVTRNVMIRRGALYTQREGGREADRKRQDQKGSIRGTIRIRIVMDEIKEEKR